ncbi:family 78 glycoside hydrolase catalytic domain [Streptomyces sp. NPDC057052]|uniref:family 78 glycoside hydrolase catalytic domain n=1 Tax=Streptomyces sp. NPDC057052 TaxID=3346010 RepID=UPI00362E8AD3
MSRWPSRTRWSTTRPPPPHRRRPGRPTLTLRHAEVLQDGELATRPLREAYATDTLILAGHGPLTWEPRFTLHGFRYAEVTG